MQIHPKVKVFLIVIGFVLILIMPVTYAIFQEYKARKAELSNPKPPLTNTVQATQ